MLACCSMAMQCWAARPCTWQPANRAAAPLPPQNANKLRVLPPSIGFSWDISAWLLFPYLQEIGPEASRALSQRVIDGIDTTFASHFSQRLSLEQVLEKQAALTINARRTGEKALILPG